ncbi:G3E family GTPase [Marmoricola sp. OAE513]|uniref:GTP-binding protein n=1 Tax=Marmoricola sp. OAE513 TaxID=2817894 RepID=UPI001AEB0BBD
MRTPLVVVTGVDPAAIDAAMIGPSWDLPDAVAVRHRIDPESQVLTRIVSHAGGIVEHVDIPLEHACVTCALREDILPTLERLGRDKRWRSVLAALPAAAEANQLGNVMARNATLNRFLRLAGVVAAVSSDDLVHDLLADDLLHERGWHSNPFDERGVGETACALIEYADLVVLDDDPGAEAADLVRALARPDARVLSGFHQVDSGALLQGLHSHRETTAWSATVRTAALPPLEESGAWRMGFTSMRPFHPERLLEQIERLGAGRHRSRGSFWVPTRPDAVLEWSGAGDQLSIGSHDTWGRRMPETRLLFTGVGTPPSDLAVAFDEFLLTATEASRSHASWNVLEDGLEPWLGDIRDVA